MAHRFKRFGSVDLVFHLENEGVESAIDRFLRRLGESSVSTTSPASSRITCTIVVGVDGLDVPEAARPVTPPTPHGGMWEYGSSVFVVSEAGGARGVIRVEPSSGEARLCLHPDLLLDAETLWEGLFVPVLWGIFLLLHPHQLYAVHAAALGREGAGLLLVADSDCGKSTLAYSLVREGWSYLSDDTVLIDTNGRSPEVIPFRRRFGLDTIAGSVFPELAVGGRELPFMEEDKWAVDVDQLIPGRAVERLAPEVIVLPQIVDSDESWIEPASVIKAHLALVSQSAFARLNMAAGRDQVLALTPLVRQTRHYKLLGGRDILRRPERAAELLGPLMGARDSQ